MIDDATAGPFLPMQAMGSGPSFQNYLGSALMRVLGALAGAPGGAAGSGGHRPAHHRLRDDQVH